MQECVLSHHWQTVAVGLWPNVAVVPCSGCASNNLPMPLAILLASAGAGSNSKSEGERTVLSDHADLHGMHESIRVSMTSGKPFTVNFALINWMMQKNTNNVEKSCILLIIGSLGTSSLIVVVSSVFFEHLLYSLYNES
jgi:hypothetical protein